MSRYLIRNSLVIKIIIHLVFFIMLSSSTLATKSWTKCAIEGGTCHFTSGRKYDIRYGIYGKYNEKVNQSATSVECNNANFGDSYQGLTKGCEYWYHPPAKKNPTWTKCSDENEICKLSETKTVRFGGQGYYDYATHSGEITCDNKTFQGADSIEELKSVKKACYYYDKNDEN